MIIPDVNLIVYAHNEESPFHQSALKWWAPLVVGDETIAIPWMVTLGFLRLMTNPRLSDQPLELERAVGIVRRWFVHPAVQPVEPGTGHLRHLSELLLQVNVGAKLVNDAHLAAIAIEQRAVLHTHDRDFERFSGLRIHDPL